MSPLWNWALLAVPFGILLVVAIVRLVMGPGHALLPLLPVGPAAAAALGGVLYTLAAGAVALGEEWLFATVLEPESTAQQIRNASIVIIAVTIGGALASYIRLRRERELTEVRAVAEVTQGVLLRPVPGHLGPVRLRTGYLSASSRAQVGGDLYAVEPMAKGLRLIIGDAEGKGLPAVEQAAAAMGAFRACAQEESTLSAVAERVEATLGREFDDEQFITAVLAEVSQDGREMVLLNCGHPQPLRLGREGPDLLGPGDGGLPLGLGPLAAGPRVPFTIPWEAGEPVLFYTDGLTEARDRAGKFFQLTRCVSVQARPDPSSFIERLSAEVSRHVSHQQQDDIALLLVWREDSNPALFAGG